MKKRLTIIIISLVFIAGLILLKIYNDNRIKSLDEIFLYDPNHYQYLGFGNGDYLPESGDKAYEWQVEDKEAVEELLDFLSNYKVKTTNEKYIQEHWNDPDRVQFAIIQSKNEKVEVSRVYLFENYVYIMKDGYYELVNGPMDMDWLDKYSEKHKN